MKGREMNYEDELIMGCCGNCNVPVNRDEIIEKYTTGYKEKKTVIAKCCYCNEE